ncbi:MAG: hypothetical protein J3K34DRAFT_455561 [Monoraphidium minutum]|nr:MAG: hypothetical protein J3K34DRAFT_455561 [Monoraphidium minutum]
MLLFDEEDGGLDDTPMFRQRVDEMEASAKRLKERCGSLLAGARKYRDGITAMLDAQTAFAAALHEFGGGTDEDSLHLGSAAMSPFIKVFRELAGFYDFLRTQLDLGLIERVQKDWVEGALAESREERRKYDRRAAEYEAARMKHQSLKKQTKREVLERSHTELAIARCGEEEARFDLARRLSEVELSKRFSFLELIVGAVHAHLMFFRNGADLLGRLEGPINDALQIGEHLRREEGERADMITARREAADRREALIAREVAALDGGGGAGPGSSGDGGGGAAGGPAGGAALSAGPGGPVQMSVANSELTADIERLIRATRCSAGQQARAAGGGAEARAPARCVVTIIRQGYLCKRSQGKGRSDWKRRFFVLDSTGMMYYYSHKADSLMQLSRATRPKNTLPLLTSTVKLDADDPVVRCAFRVVSPEGTYTLQAETEFERAEWIAALQAVINCLLSGAIDMEALPRVPVRPTHSRSGSQADAAADGGCGGGGGGRASGVSAGGLSAASGGSQPGTPPCGSALSGIPSGDGSGSDAEAHGGGGGGGGGEAPGHHRVPSRLGFGRLGGGAAAGDGGGGGGSSSGPLERLRAVSGNRRCADCGAQDPDWASLNLGVLLCIECSGVHRQLGVQVSKVRSCTLDVRVWEPQVVGVVEAIGNDASNAVWEAAMPPPGAAASGSGGAAAAGPAAAAAAPAAAAGGAAPAVAAAAAGAAGPASKAADSWVWCEGDSAADEDEARGSSGGGAGGAGGGAMARVLRVASAVAQRQQRLAADADGSVGTAASTAAAPAAGAAAAPPPPAPPAPKPGPASSLSDKARFITDKYAGRAFTAPLPREQAQARLWDAVAAGDVRAALAALAAGADASGAYRTPRAQRLVGEAAARAAAVEAGPGGAAAAGGGSSAGSSRAGSSGGGPGSGGSGDGGGLGGSVDGGHGVCGTVTALHLAATLGDSLVTEFLLQNGAGLGHTDAHGRTALHYAVLWDCAEVAKLLMRRGGGGGDSELQRCRDSRGRTPMDIAMAKGRVTDEELFVLLSTQ